MTSGTLKKEKRDLTFVKKKQFYISERENANLLLGDSYGDRNPDVVTEQLNEAVKQYPEGMITRKLFLN